jgi:superfamily II DNA or RNA helicase
MIQIEINNVRSKLIGELDSKIISSLYNKLSAEVVGSYYAQQRTPYWDGKKHFFAKASRSFSTGLLNYVREVLDKNHIEYEYNDLRIQPQLGSELPLHDIVLRDYQLDAVKKAIPRQRGIIKSATGSGKSAVAVALIGKLNIKTLLLIHKKEVFYQLIETLERLLQIPVGKIGDGLCEIQSISVGMIQTIARAFDPKVKVEKEDEKVVSEHGQQIIEFVKEVECLIADECQHLAADTFKVVFDSAEKAFYRYGFSASPWRTDNMDMLIEAGTASKIVDLSASKLIDQGYLVPPKVYLFDFKHQRKTRKGEPYSVIYQEEVDENADRNHLICNLALKAVQQDKSVLIAVTHIEHGEILEKMLQRVYPDAIFIHGSMNTKIRRQVLDDLRAKKRKLVIASTVFGEGLDVISLDCLINAKAAASSVDAFQLLGRVLRLAPNKSQAYVIDIFDNGCKHLGAHAQERLRIYSTEARYKLIPVKSIEEVNFDD